MSGKIKKIGVMGGTSIYELGPIKDIVLFFDCIDFFVVNRYKDNWSLITDRFYRRYLKLDELDPAQELMDRIKKIFSEISSSEVDWGEGMQGDKNKTWLNAQQTTLDMVFSKYFDCFNKAARWAISFDEEYGEYIPVRLSISDSIVFVLEEKRPLEQYDALSPAEKPFWLRPEHESYSFLGRNNPFIDKGNQVSAKKKIE